MRYYFYRWRDDGLLAEINRSLVAQARHAAGRDVQPTCGVIDSQSVKASENTSLSGFDAGKRIKGQIAISSPTPAATPVDRSKVARPAPDDADDPFRFLDGPGQFFT